MGSVRQTAKVRTNVSLRFGVLGICGSGTIIEPQNFRANVNAKINNDSDVARWEGVISKNAALDGSYLFGVTTTGIYYRPSYPSRRPNRANVLFFDAAEEALTSGFHAYRRCAPDGVTDRENGV